MVILHLKNV